MPHASAGVCGLDREGVAGRPWILKYRDIVSSQSAMPFDAVKQQRAE